MDWLKNILQVLPLETISDILGEIVIWWSQMVKYVPADDLPMYAYFGLSAVVLALWVLIARTMPRPLGGMTWVVLFAVLLAPGTALEDPSTIAPASISVVYAIMMKDTATALSNALPVFIVLVLGLFVGFIWQLVRGAFESSLELARRQSADDTHANMQLATGNYLAEKPQNENELLPSAMTRKVPNTTVPRTTAIDKVVSKINVSKKTAESTENLNKPNVITRKPVEGFYNKKPKDDDTEINS